MIGTAFEVTKRQGLALGAASAAAILLIFVAHAPVLPVIAGCALALGVSCFRTWSRTRK
jgi:hypothetical protein